MCNVKPGHGVGGINKRQPNMSQKKCFEHCIKKRKTNPSMNGVTVDTTGGNQCYCEYNMTSWNNDTTYKSCKIPSHLSTRKLQLF